MPTLGAPHNFRNSNMNKFSFIAAAVTAALAVSANAHASGDGPYFGANFGLTFDQDIKHMKNPTLPGVKGEITSNDGISIGGAVGYQTGPFRFEGELTHQSSGAERMRLSGIPAPNSFSLSGDVKATSLMFNGYYALDLSRNWRPFVMAGIGKSEIKLDGLRVAGVSASGTGDATAYQFGGGLEWKASQKVVGEAQYRYFKTDNFKINGDRGRLDDHQLMIGFRYKF